MMTPNKSSKFASADRSSTKQIEAEHKQVAEHVLADPFARKIIDSVKEIVMILDRNRQVVFSNAVLHAMLGLEDGSTIRGLRPGEVFHCVYADPETGGCGTSENCRLCGAVLAILAAQAQEDSIHSDECTVVQSNTGDAIELAVSASCLKVEDERYTLFVLLDISNQKRREAMERIFFHDILNISSMIKGLSEMLKMGKGDKYPDLGERIFKVTSRLIDDIEIQRSLLFAERGELQPEVEHIHANDVIKDSVEAYSNHDVAEGKKLEIDASSEDIELNSDPILLNRVVGNMIKNALEASEEGDEITVGCRKNNGAAEFWVHNSAVMPKDVQLQVFKRSFTTKGKGRGLGTYSIKLLTERYLKGEVGFESAPEKGTTFFARYPA